jgi:hypothetical protein
MLELSASERLPGHGGGMMVACLRSTMTSSRLSAGCGPPSAPSRSSRSLAMTESLAMTQRMIREGHRGGWRGGEDEGPEADDLGLPRFDGQGLWLGQATCLRISWSVVSNSSGVM